MTDTFVTPIEIPRDRYGRPMVVPEGGGKMVPYTRATTYINAIEDYYNLGQWQQRMTAVGVAENASLRAAVLADRADRDRMNAHVDKAKEIAGANDKAQLGTALHKFCEQVDQGETPTVPDEHIADIAAYVEGTSPLSNVFIESFCVLDSLRIGGTPDRVVRYKGKRYIADIKTGSLDYDVSKIARQLAVYARSKLYDLATHKRSVHGCDTTRGIVVHLPAGQGVCTLWWVDLTKGWEGVRLSTMVREHRSAYKTADYLTAFGDFEPEPEPETPDQWLRRRIHECRTVLELNELWAANTTIWTDEHTTLARDERAAIEIDQTKGRPA